MEQNDTSSPRHFATASIHELFGQRADAPMWLQMLKAPEFYAFLRDHYPAPLPFDGTSECLSLLNAHKHASTNARLSPEQYERAVLERYVFWRRTVYLNALRRSMDEANTESNRIDRWLCGRTYD